MKIKNCPFCGSEVELRKIPLWSVCHSGGYPGCYEYVISCNKCGCNKYLGKNNTVYNTDEEAKQNAIDNWNMRAYKKEKKKEKKEKEYYEPPRRQIEGEWEPWGRLEDGRIWSSPRKYSPEEDMDSNLTIGSCECCGLQPYGHVFKKADHPSGRIRYKCVFCGSETTLIFNEERK